MGEMIKKRLREILPIFIIGLTLLIFVIMCAVYSGNCEKELGRLDGGWTLSGTQVNALPKRDLKRASESSFMQTTLGSSFNEMQTLCFYSVFEDVTVRLDGKEIYRFSKPDGEKITRAAPSYWNIVPLPDDCAGSVLEIELSTPYQLYANTIPQVRWGSLQQVSRYVQAETVPRFVAAMAVLFMGLIFSIVAVFLQFYVEGNSGLYSLSLFFIVFALFLACQQTNILLGLYGESAYIVIQYAALMLAPVLYTRYLTHNYKGFFRKVALGLHWVSVFNFLMIMTLQLLKVRDMPEIMSSTRNLIAIVIIYVFILEMRHKRRIYLLMLSTILIYIMYHYFFTGQLTWLLYVVIFAYAYILVQRIVFTVVRAQAKEIRLKAELEVSRSEIATVQITSHFFYHTLDSIRALIRIDGDKAYKMTGDFAKYMRYRVDGVERMEESVPFAKELRSIRAYADIKQAQLGDRFRMYYDVETEDFEILPLTVQPLVENAVIHAVQRRREGGEVRLVCRETDSGYRIEVIDNGPGPNALPEVRDAQKKSVAIKNVNTRLEFYGIAPLEFISNEEGGMTVRLVTPKKIPRKGKTE